jgi:DNA-binding transcriptional LysR family regulator
MECSPRSKNSKAQQIVSQKMVAVKDFESLTGYDLAMSDTRRALRGETDQVRIGYLPAVAQQYLRGLLREVRRSRPETDLQLVGLTPGQQIVALRAGEIDIGITNESGKLLAGEFYTRKLAEVGSCIALPEQHRLATQDRVRLSDLNGEFFLSLGSQVSPGWDRRVEEYCKKYGKFLTILPTRRTGSTEGGDHVCARSKEPGLRENTAVHR